MWEKMKVMYGSVMERPMVSAMLLGTGFVLGVLVG